MDEQQEQLDPEDSLLFNESSGDLFFDDLDCIFDDNAPADELTIDAGNLSSFLQDSVASENNGDNMQPPDAVGSVTALSSLRPSSGNTDRTRRRRSNNWFEGAERGLPPPNWHCEAADKSHRRGMILEIARLLKARKKTQPSQEWLRQLPHKARRLEDRLYRTSPSLEAYMDRSTLKNRLKKLARVITKQYREARREKRLSESRSSTASQSTVSSALTASSSLRDSFASNSTRDSCSSHTSMDSLRSLQNAVNQKANVSSDSGTRSQSEGSKLNNSEPRTSAGGSSPSHLSSIPEGAATSPAPQTIADSSEPETKDNETGDTADTHKSSTASGSGGSGISSGLESMSELERQKAVNEKLQQQILENIRQQEELVRQLQSRRQVQAPTSAGTHAQTQPPMSGISQGGQQAPVPVASSGQTQDPVTASMPAADLSSSISNKIGGSVNISSPVSMPPGNAVAASLQRSQVPNVNALNFSAMSGAQQNMLVAHAARTALFNSAIASNSMQPGSRMATPMAPTAGVPNLYSNLGNTGVLPNSFTANTQGVYAASSLSVLGRPNILGTNQAFLAAMQRSRMLQGAAGNPVAGGYNQGMPAPSNSAQGTSNNSSSGRAPEDSNSEAPLSPSKFNW